MTVYLPALVHRSHAVSEPAVDGALRGEQRSQRLAPLVDVVHLAAHHPRHHALPRVCRLDRHVGHPGHRRRAAGDGHFQPVGLAAADDIAPLEHRQGARQIEVWAQFFRLMVQAVAVGPRLGPEPRLELIRCYGPEFLHRLDSPAGIRGGTLA